MTRATTTRLGPILIAAAVMPHLYAWPAAALKQTGTIPLATVSGRIDHLAYDAARQHLFVAALGTTPSRFSTPPTGCTCDR